MRQKYPCRCAIASRYPIRIHRAEGQHDGSAGDDRRAALYHNTAGRRGCIQDDGVRSKALKRCRRCHDSGHRRFFAHRQRSASRLSAWHSFPRRSSSSRSPLSCICHTPLPGSSPTRSGSRSSCSRTSRHPQSQRCRLARLCPESRYQSRMATRYLHCLDNERRRSFAHRRRFSVQALVVE